VQDRAYGGEPGILILALWRSSRAFSNLHKNRINAGDFHDLALLQLSQSLRINSANFGPKTDTKDAKSRKRTCAQRGVPYQWTSHTRPQAGAHRKLDENPSSIGRSDPAADVFFINRGTAAVHFAGREREATSFASALLTGEDKAQFLPQARRIFRHCGSYVPDQRPPAVRITRSTALHGRKDTKRLIGLYTPPHAHVWSRAAIESAGTRIT
jgi:hypothetical protein